MQREPTQSAPEILLELGRGGMGTAYLARIVGAERFERLVVIKRLHSHLAEVPSALERFLDEARLAAHVRHANVIGTQQVARDELGPYLVLDYVEGSGLDGLVDLLALKKRAFPLPIALRIMLDALAGLEAVHGACDSAGRHLKMLHRDVTLQNVLVGRDGVSRIADFGVAKSAIGSVKTDEKYLVGKLLYMPPEYLRREPTDARLDVYALGVTLWLVLAGRDLWAGASEEQLVTHILVDSVPPISDAHISVPPQIEALVQKACDKDPAQRFASAREMAAEIERIGRETGWVASHAEVAEFVEELCGKDLAERRREVAALVEREPERGTDPGRSESEPALPLELRPRLAQAEPPPVVPKRSLLLPALGGATLLVLAGFLAVRSVVTRPAASPEPTPAATESSVVSTPSSSASGARAEKVIAPVASMEQVASRPVARTERDRPQPGITPPKGAPSVAPPAPASAPLPAPPPAPVPVPPPATTEGISKTNPYVK